MSLIRGRFLKEANELTTGYTSSVGYDWQLYPYDIAGSIAHARMLAKQGIIEKEEAEQIVQGLQKISDEIENGVFRFWPDLEDVHMNIESRLTSMIGDTGGKLHTGRSRNDQVAVDMRLYVKDVISGTLSCIRNLQKALLDVASANEDIILPGFTHLQPAQPVLFAHHLLAYFEMLQRDAERFEDCLKRTDVLPLGSGALAGVTYDIDRDFVAKELGFSQVSRNSLDAVSDRDFVIEYEAAASICLMHLSRLAEEMVIWSSPAFDFIEIDDAYTTGSSIMPQKKNPDVAELARGKTGRVYGHLIGMLTTMKALPLAYNRDLQEDKEGLFDTADTVIDTLAIFTNMVQTLKAKPQNMRQMAERGYLLATDIADYLVEKGETFRRAYNAVTGLVRYALEKQKQFHELSLNEYRQFSPIFGKDVYNITVESAVAARNVSGGTAPKQVAKAIARARKLLESSGAKQP